MGQRLVGHPIAVSDIYPYYLELHPPFFLFVSFRSSSAVPHPTPPARFPCSFFFQELRSNQLSKFEYVSGDPAATLASEEILVTTAAKDGSIHSAGWCGFKPSDYGSNVRTSNDVGTHVKKRTFVCPHKPRNTRKRQA